MSGGPDLTTPGAWQQTETLLLLRRVMGLGDDVRRRIAADSGLSVTELVALEHLADGVHGPAEIARLLDVSTAASTGIVDRLESKGHVERHPHSQDRRRTEVRMTRSAHQEIMAHLGPMLGELARLDDSLTDDERDVITRYLTGVLVAARRVVDDEGH